MGTSSPIRHVAVVGLMGSGKTTTGSRLADRLGWPLVDSDAEIEAKRGRTVRELRDELGVEAMHRIEAEEALGALAAPGPSVVCPAASVIDMEACLHALADPSVLLVFLTTDPAVAARRFLTGEHRPWFGDDPETFLARQALTRYPRIRALHPVEIATDVQSPDEIVAQLTDILAQRGVQVPPA